MLKCKTIIDDTFGDDYAKEHPELLGAMIQASAADYLANRIDIGFERLAHAITQASGRGGSIEELLSLKRQSGEGYEDLRKGIFED